ncbi:RNA polymerase subunit sigma-24 [Actinophytocola xinjiangensis]|uniref:RNA polymerase subunit sigma-24 n=1 Tax=Actinophytocola xinjiangensis TaxID=485602 RepID=A0A7Z1ATV1_9PSEU|nr:sigma-70 family RNA polymerase sigma factor [Actinophytocola xinjiangensis]OLF04266.1 RNA polymerase subunit sigma-24 [Actinophytocola xinjiangensis]
MNTATEGVEEPRTDPGAGFDSLFESDFEAMKRLAYLLGADDPENVAQESFARLHARWHTLTDADKAAGYLRATVVNLSRSRLRHLRVARRAPRERPADAASAEERVLAGHESDRLRAALATLPARQRQVLVLRYWLDLDQRAIADTLGIAVGTVKATTSHALANLRKAWPEQEER